MLLTDAHLPNLYVCCLSVTMSLVPTLVSTQAPSVKAEYARLKALRAEIHELRPKLESEAQEVRGLLIACILFAVQCQRAAKVSDQVPLLLPEEQAMSLPPLSV